MQCGRWGVDRGQAAPWSWCGRAVYLQPRWSRGATARSNTQHSPPPRPFHSHHSAAQPNRPTVVRARRCMVACRLRAGRHLDASHGNTRTQHRIARRGSWPSLRPPPPASILPACERHALLLSAWDGRADAHRCIHLPMGIRTLGHGRVCPSSRPHRARSALTCLQQHHGSPARPRLRAETLSSAVAHMRRWSLHPP